MDSRIIIPTGVTPTGIGIRQRKNNGALRPLTPCCSRYFVLPDQRQIVCQKCGKDYTGLEGKLGGSLANDVPPDLIGSVVIKSWISNITGLDIDTLEVNYS